jgi:hypothetical protein
MDLDDPGSASNERATGNQIATGNVAGRPIPRARRSLITIRMEEREADKAPLQWPLIRRIFHYTKPYAAKRNWLFVLTFTRGLQLPALRG